MSAQTVSGKVVFREWATETGMAESEGTFTTLEELFEICFHRQADEPLVDRVIIEGDDDDGHRHRLVLKFQSVSE